MALSSAREKRRRSKLQEQGGGRQRSALRSRSSSELPQRQEQDQPDYATPPAVLTNQTNVSTTTVAGKGTHEEGEGESGKEEEEVMSLLDCTLHLPEARDQRKQEWAPKEAFTSVPPNGGKQLAVLTCPELVNHVLLLLPHHLPTDSQAPLMTTIGKLRERTAALRRSAVNIDHNKLR